jgi:hypothetical protein
MVTRAHCSLTFVRNTGLCLLPCRLLAGDEDWGDLILVDQLEAGIR